MSLWLVISNTLAVFNIKPATNPKTGAEELPEIKFHSGETSNPYAFKCRVVPRSEHHAKLVRDLNVIA